MIVKASDRRDISMSGVAFQVVGLIVISWGFLIPAPLSIRILVALSVTFIILVVSHLQSAMTFSRKEAEAHAWFQTLVLRTAVDMAMASARRGEYAPIDWMHASQEAVEDIKRAQEDDKLQEGLGAGGTVAWLLTVPFMVAVGVVYPLIGYGIAVLVRTFVPGVVPGS